MTAIEVAVNSEWCQRWTEQRASWRHRSEGGFDPSHYTVQSIDELVAKGYVERHHYSGTYPAAAKRYGLVHRSRLVGVAVFGIPVQAKVLTNVFPDLEPYRQSLELSRFVLHDACPGNSESWFLARCFTELLAVDVHGVVSFADPVPRRASDGRVICPGHIGTIYQATNAAYTGRGTARTVTVLPDGTTLNARSIQKVRRQENGHEYVEARLIALGAPAPRAGLCPKAWLAEALDAVRARQLRHRGCHRYAFPLGRNKRARDRIAVAPSTAGYPKGVDE